MLSRTADNLFWLSRYVERADAIARVLDVALRFSSLPAGYAARTNEWESALRAAGAQGAFEEHHSRISRKAVIDFLAFSPDNPSSIRSCLQTARTNARAIRTALTSDMWETINSAWLEMRDMDPASITPSQLARFLAWAKDVSVRYDGFAYRTMLRAEAYYFTRMGLYIERGDNTARILDVKYHLLLPESAEVGGGLDYYQWSSVLRAVSAQTSYHWVYKDSLKPWLVAELLILRPQMPRSLISCYENLARYLDLLARDYGRQGESQRMARSILTQLRNSSTDEIYKAGLHEFLGEFIASNHALGQKINEQYLI